MQMFLVVFCNWKWINRQWVNHQRQNRQWMNQQRINHQWMNRFHFENIRRENSKIYLSSFHQNSFLKFSAQIF